MFYLPHDIFAAYLLNTGAPGGGATYLINLILTCRSIPGEVKEIFGARDGDHLTNIGTGPAGDLVPRGTATWQRDRERPRNVVFVIIKGGNTTCEQHQQHNRCLDSICYVVVRWLHSRDKQSPTSSEGLALEFPWQPKPGTLCQLLLQPWLHNSGWP